MVSIFSKTELMTLVEHQDSPAISVYMSTHPTGRAQRQDAIRLKNLVREAADELERMDSHDVDAKQLLQPIQEITGDEQIWEHRSKGLAMFSARDLFTAFTFPREFADKVVVNDRFHVSPLLPLLHSNGRYFILALTKDSAELYEATRSDAQEQELPDVRPIAVDEDQRSLQYHSHQTSSADGRGNEEAIYHGHGGSEEREKVDIANFFKRQVEPGVSDALVGQQAPLLLVCVDYLASIYQQVNTYDQLAEDHVSGSPDELSESELREKAWKFAQPLLREEAERAQKQYEQLATAKKCEDPHPILDAARQGRIDTLLVSQRILTNPSPAGGRRQNGDASTTELAQSIENATKYTLLHSGRVLAVEETPSHSPMVAILRY